MPSKLALHVHRSGADIDRAIRSAPWAAVKALDTVAPLQTAKSASINIRILRLYGIESLDAPSAVARWLSYDLGAVTHAQLVCETRCSDVAWQQAVIEGLAGGGYRGRYLVGGWPTGTPSEAVGNPPHFPELESSYPLLRRPDVALALDQYSGVLATDSRWPQWSPWTDRRHAYILADLARQGIAADVITCEAGGDNVVPVTTGGGWQARGWSAADYLGYLTTVDRADQRDSGLLARCVYTLGAEGTEWAPYDVAPVLDDLAAYVRSQAPVPVPTPKPKHKEVHVPIPEFDQGPTDLCWLYCIKAAFASAGYTPDNDTIYQAVQGHRQPGDVGETAGFGQVKAGIVTLAGRVGATLEGPIDLDTPADVDQAIRDGWIVIAGVAEQDLQPGQQYGHFLILTGFDGQNVTVADSYRHYDGNGSDEYPVTTIHQGMVDNWDPRIDAIGVKLS